MRSPIIWYGGKGLMAHKIVPFIPSHTVYCEVFGGGASLLFVKEPSPVEIYNDIDQNLVNLFRVLRDKEKFQEFYRRVCLTPLSRKEYNDCLRSWNGMEDEVERAYRFFIALRQSFGGRLKTNSWRFTVNTVARGVAEAVSGWLGCIDDLPEVHARLMCVQIECNDFRRIFEIYDTPETFFFLDPPYVMETRKAQNYGYACEMGIKDYVDLFDLMKRAKGMTLLCGYRHEIHGEIEGAGWERIEFEVGWRVKNTRGKQKEKVIESIWLCPKIQQRLKEERAAEQRRLFEEFTVSGT